MQIEKNVMFIILLLIVAVAAFNIVSTLVMAVQDKQADIAILRTLGRAGLDHGHLRDPGALIGLIGLASGCWAGGAGAQHRRGGAGHRAGAGIQFWPRTSITSPTCPPRLQWADVITISSVSFVLTLVATLYPSWRASRLNPAEALRYE